MRYPDEQLEFWGEVFVACRLREEGLTFERFLQDPWGWLAHFGQESAPGCLRAGFRPLLPAQARVARRLREEEERARPVSRGREAGGGPPRRVVAGGRCVH